MAKRPSNKFVRKAIREIIEPELAKYGFEGKYPEFKRITDTEIHFFDIQTAKYGGSFGYTVGWCRNGPLTHWDEQRIPTEEIQMLHLPFDNRASVSRMIDMWRLNGEKFRATLGGFDYTLIIEDEAACRELVREAAETLPQAMTWLDTREPQDAISAVGHHPPLAQSRELTLEISRNKEENRLRSIGLLD
ncbi:DUF4304 domain-containing protein [Pontixanthobacter luteolus]|uniref:DUF4304 domain-containing protein n=1 Tax=Pontixanthobacter luteolus TaxID=295089 RepID=UPI0023040854|nr:DUF4304 domain-containing protein [Pontixanthobacter luteolus]